MPRLRVHSEGERVHIGDPIVLMHLHTGLWLDTGRAEAKLPDGKFEVCAVQLRSTPALRDRGHHEALRHPRVLPERLRDGL